MLSIAAGVSLLLLALPLPQRFPAETEDAYALRVNPAGLGFLRGAELRLLYGHDELALGPDAGRRVSNGFGVFGAWSPVDGIAVGAAFERDFLSGDDRGAIRLGFGFGSEAMTIGASYARVDRPVGADQDRFDVGLAFRPARWLAAGFTVADLAERTQRRRYDLSAALRPGWDRLLVSVRWRLTQGEPLNDDTLDLAFRAAIEPLPGLRFGLGTNVDLDVFAQLGFDLGRSSSGGFFHVVDDQAQAGGELAVRTVPASSAVVLANVAVVDLSGDLVQGPRLALLRGEVEVEPYGAVPRQVRALAVARGLEGLFVRIGALSVGWGRAMELRRALLSVRRAGRRVDCQLSGTGDLEYFVATACSEIIVAPPLLLRVDGLASTSLFFGEALGRLGVRFEVQRFGRFKNAPDRLTRGQMSAEERERVGRYLDVLYEALVSAVATSRNLSEEEVGKQLDLGVLTATAAQSAGLVDAVLYPDEVEAHLRRTYRGGLRLSKPETFLPPTSPRPWRRRPAIAAIHIDAPITGGRSSASPLGLGQTVGAFDVVRALEAARRSPQVKAVVLRVNSPGGDALASDLIARAVEKTASSKPVVASFGDVAASGGYYVAAPADRIFAESTSLTGSIGIYSVKLDVSQLLGRLGIGVEVLSRGETADERSSFRARSPQGDRSAREALASSYLRFLRVVADGRGLPLERVRALAEGRIWTGRDALDVGLVDDLGDFEAAFRFAAKRAGCSPEDTDLIVLPEPYRRLGSPIDWILSAATEEPSKKAEGSWLKDLFGSLAGRVDARLPLLASPEPLALLPFIVEVE